MKHILIKLILLYKKIPGNFHNQCRFVPRCSDYAIMALNEYGSIKGSFLALKRIIRCNPWGRSGYDPLPKKEKKMKKIWNSLLILTLLVLPTGCFKRDSMEGITIYTTVYPIEYITTRLYGDNSSIYSIYPDGVIVNDYELTDKQIRDYSKADLFIFDGLSNEKEYVSKFFDYNKNIKIVDSAASMEYTNRIEELWLNPSNLLMLAQNIKRGFNEYINNHYLKNSIEENYEQLKIDISNLDANINLLVEGSNNKTIVVSDNAFKFLTKYGFTVISLGKDESGSISDKAVAQAKTLIASKKINYIFAPNNEELNEAVQKLKDETKVEIKYLHTLSNITEKERSNKKDYITIMNENIEALKDEIYD